MTRRWPPVGYLGSGWGRERAGVGRSEFLGAASPRTQMARVVPAPRALLAGDLVVP